MKRIAILGSTGSIGTSALAVVDAHPDRVRVVGLAAGRNADALSAQITRYRPAIAALASDDPMPASSTTRVVSGASGLVEVATHPDVDILLATRVHGQGLGTDAMRTIMRHLVEERGHHRITLSTWPHNARAIHMYEKLGFRQVGITRQSERGDDGSWHDELLMEYVADPRD